MDQPRRPILFLFPNDWDQAALQRFIKEADQPIIFEGFDRHDLANRLRLVLFDPQSFVNGLIRKYRGRIDGVTSNDDHYGALMASLIAEALGLPGNDPKTVVTCQHKYLSRQAEARILPQGTPGFKYLHQPPTEEEVAALSYPIFLKPIKSSFSILARKVDSPLALKQATRFSWTERVAQRVLLRPVEKLQQSAFKARRQPAPEGLWASIAESVMHGQQVNVDGYVFQGQVYVLGIVDAVMYPGTHAFQRFEYPSRLPTIAQEAVEAHVCRLIEGLQYRHGFFNVEVFVATEPDTEQPIIKTIEVNARLARQLTSLYEAVDSWPCWEALMRLALGRPPAVHQRRNGAAKVAASFVLRTFNTSLPPEPSQRQVNAVKEQVPDAHVHLYFKPRGMGLKRELRWVGSYRFGVINLHADSREDLCQKYAAVLSLLGLQTPALVSGFGLDGPNYLAQTTAKY